LKKEKSNARECLYDVLNRKGVIDLTDMAIASEKTPQELIVELSGIIFQNPTYFSDKTEYDLLCGWEYAPSYLSGDIREKLLLAQAMNDCDNESLRGRFESNIKALKSVMPEQASLENIHISLGASWIPPLQYGFFIKDFLKLSVAPRVIFVESIGKWIVRQPPECKSSVLNNITYGVRGETVDNWTKQYLTSIDIIEQTLNAKTVKVYDYMPIINRGEFEYEPVLNKAKTLEAQEKQQAIIEGFKDWVYSKRERSALFESYYNETLSGFATQRFDGSFLSLPEVNPEVKFYKHQLDAIARILLTDKSILLAHDVGTGKTYEMIVAVHELKRLGKSEKNLIVVPNNVLQASIDAHKYLYPDDDIFAVYPKDFTPLNRFDILNEVKNGDYTAIYMAYSSFDMIVMGKPYNIEKMTTQINDLVTVRGEAHSPDERKVIDKQIHMLSKRLDKYRENEAPCEWQSYEELNITTLVVDEAHNYKNVPILTQSDNIVGLSTNGSKKCREMLEKVHNTRRVIFATGTPLTNSLADLFTFQNYLQPKTLKKHRIGTFDTWVNTFGKRETLVECDVDANSASLRTTTRFSSFHNLQELMNIFGDVCDFHHMEENEAELPEFNGHDDICVPKNSAQNEYIKGLSVRTENVRRKLVARTEDNLLKVTTDGRKAALDIRLVDDTVTNEFDGTTKTDICAKQVYELYEAFPGTSQVVFSDLGTPKAEFNIYDTLLNALVKCGIPRDEIAFVHDAVNENARSQLFEDMNSGRVRVVIGSTQKLGVGVNIQEKLVALHHLSVPWRPADMVQREGRIIRKGNTCREVFIFRYITEGSFDAYSWQLLENKQRFISSFLSGTATTREAEDIADTVLSYAEVKALAIGNPLIKKRVEVSNLLERTKIASRSRVKQMQELKFVIASAPEKAMAMRRLADIARADGELYRTKREAIPNSERTAFGEELLFALQNSIDLPSERVFATYQGFEIVLPQFMSSEEPYIIVKSENGGRYNIEIGFDKTPIGYTKSLDYLLEHLTERAERLYGQAEGFIQQQSDASDDLAKGNPYLIQADRLKAELDEIDKQLEQTAV